MKAGIIAIAAAFTLAACSHSLTLIDRKDGTQGAGTAVGGGGSGTLQVTLRERTYEGRWHFAGSGSAGYVVPFAGGTGGPLGVMAGASASPGVMHATAPDGSRLRCQFTYSSWTSAGFGVCEDAEGKVYDLTIN